MVGGLGDVPFYADVLFQPRNELVWSTGVRHLHFPNREVVVQLALHMQECPFPEPGSYLLELYCDNQCVADVPLQLLQGERNNGYSPTAGNA